MQPLQVLQLVELLNHRLGAVNVCQAFLGEAVRKQVFAVYIARGVNHHGLLSSRSFQEASVHREEHLPLALSLPAMRLVSLLPTDTLRTSISEGQAGHVVLLHLRLRRRHRDGCNFWSASLFTSIGVQLDFVVSHLHLTLQRVCGDDLGRTTII